MFPQPQQPQRVAPRRLVAHILPPQAPGEPSAQEIKLRMMQRLQELQREGVGGSALAQMLAGLQQHGVVQTDDRAVRRRRPNRISLAKNGPASVASERAEGSRDTFCACAGGNHPGGVPRTPDAPHGGRAARPIQDAHLASRCASQRLPTTLPNSNGHCCSRACRYRSARPAASFGNPATPPSTPPNHPGSASRVSPDGRPLSPSSRSLASLATPPGAGVGLFRRRGSFGSSSPPGSATSIHSPPGSFRGLDREPSWAGKSPLGFDPGKSATPLHLCFFRPLLCPSRLRPVSLTCGHSIGLMHTRRATMRVAHSIRDGRIAGSTRFDGFGEHRRLHRVQRCCVRRLRQRATHPDRSRRICSRRISSWQHPF
jgi:hypothetical protein